MFHHREFTFFSAWSEISIFEPKMDISDQAEKNVNLFFFRGTLVEKSSVGHLHHIHTEL